MGPYMSTMRRRCFIDAFTLLSDTAWGVFTGAEAELVDSGIASFASFPSILFFDGTLGFSVVSFLGLDGTLAFFGDSAEILMEALRFRWGASLSVTSVLKMHVVNYTEG